MEFKELIAKRRSVRKFTDREVPREVVDRILAEALSAPSARNTRTTRFLVVDDPALVARMAEMRDYGSAFLKGAPLAVLVLGDTSASDLWRENAAISATVLQLACVDPSIPLCDGAVYISGDSMYPILKSGDIVGFKEINSFSNLIYGEMYLVSFTIEGDEYLAVKYVNRSEKEGYLKLVSYNAHHDPMDIPFSTINAMAIVKFSIRRHMMM